MGERKVAWMSTKFPLELPAAFDMEVVCPESAGAAAALKGQSGALCEAAGRMGWCDDLCSYTRMGLALAAEGGGGLPRPDVLLCCDNICSNMLQWYQEMARLLSVPLLTLDIPYQDGPAVSDETVRYIQGQLEDIIHALEELTGKPWREDVFSAVCRRANDTAQAWQEVMDTALLERPVLGNLELFDYMPLLVTGRCRQETAPKLRCLAQELRARPPRSGPMPRRIFFEGTPCWPALSTLVEELDRLGLLVVAVMLLWPKKWGAKVPGSLVGIILATVVSTVLGLEELATVGDIPRTLLLEDRLSLSGLSLDMVSGLISPIVTIAALAMIESLLCGASASRMKGETFHADRELIAQGVGNMLLPFFGGVPATAAIARTSVAIKSGEETRLTSVFHSLFLLASMFLLGGVMARLPLAALAGVLMVTAWRMNEWSGIRYLFRHRFKSGISQYLLTMAATVVFDLTVAILIGVVYSALLYMAKSSRIQVSISAVELEKLRRSGEALTGLERLGVAYVTGSLSFGAAAEFTAAMAQGPDFDCLILSLRGMASIDVSGAQAVLELVESRKARGQSTVFCGVCDGVRSYFDRAGVTEAAGGDKAFYWSADRAILDLAATRV